MVSLDDAYVTEWAVAVITAVHREVLMASKDKGGRASKKTASKSLKEKRKAKQEKRATKTNRPSPS